MPIGGCPLTIPHHHLCAHWSSHGGWRHGKQGSPPALSLSPAPALCSAWTRLGVSSANTHPEEFQPHPPGSPHRVQLALQRASYSKYTFLRLPSLSPGGSELPPLLPHWEKEINIQQVHACSCFAETATTLQRK